MITFFFESAGDLFNSPPVEYAVAPDPNGNQAGSCELEIVPNGINRILSYPWTKDGQE